MWLGATLLFFARAATAFQPRETKLLVIPGTNVPPKPIFLGRKVEVLSASGPDKASKTPIYVVLDLPHTDPKNRQALLQSAAQLPQRPIQVFIDSDFLSGVDRTHFGTLLEPPLFPKRLESRGSDLMLEALINSMEKDRCPCRIFWIGQHFGWSNVWVEFGHRSFNDEIPNEPDRVLGSNVMDDLADMLTEKGIILFPVLLPNPSAFERRAATQMAKKTGAFISTLPNLNKLIADSDNGSIIEIRTPTTRRRWIDGRPHNISDRAFKFKRSLAVPRNPKPSQFVSVEEQRLIRAPKALRTEKTCQEKNEVNLLLPLSVWAAPESNLEVILDDPNNLKSRLSFPRPQTTTPTPLCLPISRTPVRVLVRDKHADYVDFIDILK